MTQAGGIADSIGLGRGALGHILLLLDSDGTQARVIGGAVRNALMGIPVDEIDIATTALPNEVMQRATAAGLKCVPTGIGHGTVTVIADGTPFEVTTLREDVETFGRKAKVAFGTDWRADALRRDFTINALSVSRDGKVHDFVGGLDDVAARRVRFVGEPARRIAEDYLRILRFFRFHAAYGAADLDPAGLDACIAARAGLETLSRERVRMELCRLVAAPRAMATLTVMTDAGILAGVLGGVAYLSTFANMVAIETATGAPREAVRGLGALGVFVTEDADRLAERLRLSNVEHARILSMAEGWWRVSPSVGEHDARVLLYRLGPAAFVDRVFMAWAHAAADAADRPWRELAALPQRWAAPVFPLKAADFMTRGVAKGPVLGKTLTAAEEAWIAAGFPDEAAALDAIAVRAMASGSS